MLPDEGIEAWIERCNQCDFRVDDADELAEFFKRLTGRLRDALSPHASYWQSPPPMGTDSFRRFVARRQWLDKANGILKSLAAKHKVSIAPLRYFERLIHGERLRESDLCREVVDAVRDIHLAVFGMDGEYVLIWDREEDTLADGTPSEDSGGSFSAAVIMHELGCKESSFGKYRRLAKVAGRRRGQQFTAIERKAILVAAGKSSDSAISANAKNALTGKLVTS